MILVCAEGGTKEDTLEAVVQAVECKNSLNLLAYLGCGPPPPTMFEVLYFWLIYGVGGGLRFHFARFWGSDGWVFFSSLSSPNPLGSTVRATTSLYVPDTPEGQSWRGEGGLK